MTIKIYNILPKEAMDIRVKVFVLEQGFTDEEDEIDRAAHHILAYDGEQAIGVCRLFKDDGGKGYILGRLAVLKEYRGTGVGKALISASEGLARSLGGDRLRLHSQCHAEGFYIALGYSRASEVEYEQGKPHIWLQRRLEASADA
ncbi:MAG: GNAT family N-acetyltransferase [Clostridia bacterium]|nr:GNAT family N-acetyltransferase [Clostridia bacterium]